ncbi:MAG: hypothetical protein ACI9MR_004338 [Myxococcota bacterium]|jgi:hypothetical protein
MSGHEDDLLEETDATLQMGEAEVAKLHAALAAADVGIPAAALQAPAAPIQDTVQGMPVPSFVAAAAAPAPAPAPVLTRPAPSAPARAPASGGGLLVTGGIGAILLFVACACSVLLVMQGSLRDEGIIIGSFSAAGLGLILVGVGLLGANSRTNPTAIVASVFAFIAGLAFLALISVMTMGSGGSAMEGFLYVAVLGLPVTVILIGAWALSAGKVIGTGLSVSTGITAILGGASLGGAVAMLLFGLSRRGLNDDGLIIAYFGGLGLVAISMVLMTIVFFGPLKSAAPKA